MSEIEELIAVLSQFHETPWIENEAESASLAAAMGKAIPLLRGIEYDRLQAREWILLYDRAPDPGVSVLVWGARVSYCVAKRSAVGRWGDYDSWWTAERAEDIHCWMALPALPDSAPVWVA